MISHQYRCIFIHIPKCGGTSVEVALGHWDGHTGWGGQDHRTLRMIEQPLPSPAAVRSVENVLEVLHRQKHRYITKIYNPKNRYTVTRVQYESYFKFTIIRNPWARAFSWYQNVLRDPVHRKTYGVGADVPFADFLGRFVGHGVMRPQLYWLKAFDGSLPFDYVARFEDFSHDMAEVFARLGLEGVPLPHEQSGSGLDYRDYYDDRANDIIRRAYWEEIESFGYSFEAG